MGLWDVGLCLARVRNVIHTPLAFRSIPFRPRLLFCSQAPASRGAAVFFFHLATSRSFVDPQPRESTFRIAKSWIVFSLVSVKCRSRNPSRPWFPTDSHSFVGSGSITESNKKPRRWWSIPTGDLTLIHND